MTTYRYKGRSPDGAGVSGVVRAYDEYEAVAKLRDTCAFITKIEAVPEGKTERSAAPRARLSDKELALICSQLSIILTTGLPITRCLETVASQSRSKRTRRMLEKVAEDVGAGRSLAQSFEQNAPNLPRTFIETVRAGEQSGALELCFERLHRYYDKTAKTRAKVISTLTYPAMVVVAAVIVFLLVVLVAVPAFSGAFAEMGTELPAVTRGLLAVSDFFVKWWWLVLLLLFGLCVVSVLLMWRSEKGRTAFSAFALHRAPLHRLRAMSAAGQFASTMATMLAAGLQVPKALEVAGQVSGSFVFASGVREVRQNVERGRGIAESMEKLDCFPRLLTEMIGVGERSGTLEETLDVVGSYFDNEVETTTARLIALLEPLITVALAVVVVVLLLAVYLPMFSLYGAM